MQRNKCPIQRCSLLNNWQLNPTQKFPFPMVLPHSIYLQPCCNKVWRFPNLFCLFFASLWSLMNGVVFILWTFGWVRKGAERQLTFGITEILLISVCIRCKVKCIHIFTLVSIYEIFQCCQLDAKSTFSLTITWSGIFHSEVHAKLFMKISKKPWDLWILDSAAIQGNRDPIKAHEHFLYDSLLGSKLLATSLWGVK